jgi:GntR family transcriptional regulator
LIQNPKVLFRINHQSKSPLYNLIEENFHELISSEKLKTGDAIPSEWELSELFNVSRLTVRHALGNLVRQGWLNRRQGVGTFVAKSPLTRLAPSRLSFTEQMRAVGRVPSSRQFYIRVIPATLEVASHLKIAEGDPVIEIRRLRLADGEPIMLETTYLSQARFPGINSLSDFSNTSLYEYLSSQYQINVAATDQTLTPVLLSESEAKDLDSRPRTPAIFSEIEAFTGEGVPIEYSRSITPGDKSKFYFRFRRGENAG